jgi:hypothetical protein
MEQQAFPGLPVGNGHLQGGYGRMDGLHIGTEGPANDFPVIKVSSPPSDIPGLLGCTDT